MADSQFDSLVILAGRDFGALKALVQIDGLLSPAYFHAQQAIEKTLKAVLSARAVNYPLTHNLMLLSEELLQAGVVCPIPDQMLRALTPFGVQARYNEDIESVATADEVLQVVQQAMAWCEAFRPDR